MCLAAGLLLFTALTGSEEKSGAKNLLYSGDVAINIELVNLKGITLKYKNISNQSGWLQLPVPASAKDDNISNGINPYLVFVFYADRSERVALDHSFTLTQFTSPPKTADKVFLQPNEEYIRFYGSETLYIWGPCGTGADATLANAYRLGKFNGITPQDIQVLLTFDRSDKEDIIFANTRSNNN